jgi:DIE2/ALG10 family
MPSRILQAAALAPAMLNMSAVKDGVECLRQRPLAAAVAGPVAVAVAAAAIEGGTVVHPYLLADNRQAGSVVSSGRLPCRHLAVLLTAQQVWIPARSHCHLLTPKTMLVLHTHLLSGRHYTFYLWKDTLGRSAALRRWLAPAYVIAAAAVWRRLRAAQPPLWCAAWAACTAAVLVPAALLELRWGVGV